MNARLAAARALAKVLAGQASLATSLPVQLARVAVKDRALVQDLSYGSARWHPRLSGLLAHCLEKPLKAADTDLEALLLIGLYQLLYTRIPAHAVVSETLKAADLLKKTWSKGLLNAVLRRIEREGAALLTVLEHDPVIRTAHPRWLQKKLKTAWPEHWELICQANNLHPPMTLRVNALQTNNLLYRRALEQIGMQATPCPFAAQGLRLENACPVSALPGFTDGACSVQDEAAQLAAPLLELSAGQRVLDACCAPGGKTTHLLETEPAVAEVFALDNAPQRLTRVVENLTRLNLSARLIAADAADLAAWWDGQLFERILLDAPCSATGVLRRHPDIKLTRLPEDLPPLCALQAQLLEALWKTLAPGGILLYATCSVLPEENTKQIGAFLAQTVDAQELVIDAPWGIAQTHGRQLLPTPNGHDGFYYAKLQKRDDDGDLARTMAK